MLFERALPVCVLAALLGGCGIGDALDDDDDDDTFHIRSVNLIEDSATVSVLIGETTIASIDYGASSGFSAAHPGNNEISLQAVLPTTFDTEDDDDDPLDIGQSQLQTFLKDTPYTLIAYGTIASPKMFFVEGWSQRDGVADDKVVLQFAHAAPSAAQMDVYVIMPQAGITVSQFVATLNLTEASAPLELTLTRDSDDLDQSGSLTGDLIIELRAVGSGQTLFKSDEVTVGEQTRLLFTIANSTAPGPSAVKLVTLAGGSTGEVLEKDDGAALRFVHVSPDTPALDVSVAAGFSEPFARGVGFRGISDHASVNSGEVGIIAVPQNDPSAFVFLEEFTAGAGATYSAYAIGPRADVDAVVFTDESRSVPTQSKFRFLIAAPSLAEQEAIDIYLRLPGKTVDFEDDDTKPTFSAIAYRGLTSYLTYKEGSYDVYFAYSGSSTVILGPVSFQTYNGDIATLVLQDDENGTHELAPISDVRVRADAAGFGLGAWDSGKSDQARF